MALKSSIKISKIKKEKTKRLTKTAECGKLFHAHGLAESTW
jgi:hypothetical protein